MILLDWGQMIIMIVVVVTADKGAHEVVDMIENHHLPINNSSSNHHNNINIVVWVYTYYWRPMNLPSIIFLFWKYEEFPQ